MCYMKTAVETILVSGIGNTIAASSRCARTILSRAPVMVHAGVGLGRRAKSRTRSASCVSASSRRACGNPEL